MGGTHSKPCNKVAREIWLWCLKRKIWLTATHIPGIKNEPADRFSRKFRDRTEWQLNRSIFKLLVKRWGRPEIDLFASRHNYQLKPFVSWHADPDAFATDAMSLSWKHKFVYIFPPFSMLFRVLQKLQEDQSRALVIAPTMENTRLVSQDGPDVNQQTSTSTQRRIPSMVATRPDQAPPSMAQTSNDGMSLVRARLRQQNI